MSPANISLFLVLAVKTCVNTNLVVQAYHTWVQAQDGIDTSVTDEHDAADAEERGAAVAHAAEAGTNCSRGILGLESLHQV